MAIKKEILDELLKDRDPKTMFSSEGLLGELKKALAERVLNAEMDHHLADSTQDEVSEGDKPGNHRNGYSKKTVLTENEALELSIPRDRRGKLRAAADCKVPTPISRLRRQDHLDVRARHEHAGDSRAFARAVWH